MTPLEAFDYITTYSVDKNGKLHIEDMNKYLECCSLVEKTLNYAKTVKSEWELQRDFASMLEQQNNEKHKVLRIIVEKGLSLNELWFIKQNKSWEEYTETMKEIYFDDECVEKNLKTKGEYELLKEYFKWHILKN